LLSERKLGKRFEATCNSAMEVLKMVGVSGLLTIKRGSGISVADVTSRSVVDSFTSILKLQKMSMSDLTQAWIVFEPGTARLQCENMTAEHIWKAKTNNAQT